jgi:putative membrane protein
MSSSTRPPFDSKFREWCYRVWPPLPVWRRLDLSVLLICLYTAGVAAFFDATHYEPPQWGAITAALTALVLSPLLTFRNREAYDRWWEARRLWGQLVNDSRNLMVKVNSLSAVSPSDRTLVGCTLSDFAVALKQRLYGTGGETHRPLEISGELYHLVESWRTAGQVSEMQLVWLDPHLRALMDVCGACERILSSPVPLSYRALLRHGIVLYLLTLPWFLSDQLGYWSIPAIGLLGYFLMGIELTAEDVENPFGTDGDDLALASYCETIRKSVEEVLATPAASADRAATSLQTASNPA